jgi:ANTAR domain-containing protein
VRRAASRSHDLEGAFGRRAVAERTKGILMERNSIDESAAFDMLPSRLGGVGPGRLSTGGKSGVLIDRLRVESVSRALVVPAVHRQS